MSPTVLVADDSRTIRKVVEMALKAAPFDVVSVGSAQEAMKAAERSPSVILLDYHMPDGNGFDVCRALKKNGNTAQIPVIMLGGNQRDFSEDQAKGAGAADVFMKPFNTDTLLDAITTVADGSAQAAQPAEPAVAQPAQSTPTPPPADAGGPPSAPSGPPSAPSGPPAAPGSGARRPNPLRDSGSQPRVRTDSGSQPRMRTDGGSKPRMRTDGSTSGSQPRIPDAGSQPRIPDAGSQPAGGGSQPRISTPDVNASTRAQDVSNAGASAPGGTTNDSGVSNIGMSRAEIETMVKEVVKKSVKEQLPGLLRNIMGEVFQKKVLPKLLEHGEQRVDAIVQKRLGEQIQESVRVEIERLLAED